MPIEHEVKQGDSTVKLADEHGFFSDTIWNDPANADLKKKRENMDVLLPGDVIVIPDKKPKDETKPTEQRHRFRRKGMPGVFRLQVFEADEPRANQRYILTAGSVSVEGTTDATGTLQEFVPPDCDKIKLVIGDDQQEHVFKIGHLDPINEMIGVQKRLFNLGHDPGPFDGQLSSQTRNAISAFQQRFDDLENTGEPDGPTVDRLDEVHDNVNDFPEQTSSDNQ